MIQPVTDTFSLSQPRGYCGGLLLSASKRPWLRCYGSEAMMNRLLYLAIYTTTRAADSLQMMVVNVVLHYIHAND